MIVSISISLLILFHEDIAMKQKEGVVIENENDGDNHGLNVPLLIETADDGIANHKADPSKYETQ